MTPAYGRSAANGTYAALFQILGRMTVVSASVRHAFFEGGEAPHVGRAALLIGQ